MKVAYLFGSLNCGGAEMLLLDVFKNAYNAPFNFIGIHRKGGVLQEQFNNTKVSFIACPMRHGIFQYIIQLRRILQREHVTIVHTQMPIDCIFARFAICGLPIRLVTTFHGFDIGAHFMERLRNRLAISLANKVCFVSQYERNTFAQRYANLLNKGVVVYNGVDFTRLDQISTNNMTQMQSSYKVKLCMVGSFGGGRSHVVICKAFQRLKTMGAHCFKNADFYFIGARRISEPQCYDDCVAYCQQYNLDNIHFLGGRSDVPQLLQQMDGFVYSTVHDTFGIAVVEAMAAGLPVIVNDWIVMKEITHDGKWATLFRTEDVEDCANKIQDLIEHLPERKELAKQIAKEVREEYSIEKHIARLNEIYTQI